MTKGGKGSKGAKASSNGNTDNPDNPPKDPQAEEQARIEAEEKARQEAAEKAKREAEQNEAAKRAARRAAQKNREAERRQTEAVAKLRQELKAGRLAICVGSGSTISAVPNEFDRLTWLGLIQNGLDFLDDQAKQIGEDNALDVERAQELLSSKNWNEKDILDAAARLQAVLSKRPDLYSDWLKNSFKTLSSYVTNTAILESLRRLNKSGASLLTTNYDDLIEKYCKLSPLDRLDPYGMQSYSRGTSHSVFHPHGYWRNAETVVLSAKDYWDVVANSNVQECLKNTFRNKTVLFVGCGGGLNDPNFGQLLKWVGEQYKTRGASHYILLRKGEASPVTNLPLSLLRCESFADISRWLMDLLDESERVDGAIDEIPENSKRRTIERWLSPVDQSGFLKDHYDIPGIDNFEDVLLKQKGDGGVWDLVNGEIQPVWVTGKSPGFGKTMLCSSVIKNTQESCKLGNYQRARDSLAYFFCSTYDSHHRFPTPVTYSFNQFCRTVIAQLCPPNQVFPVLQDLYTKCTKYHPSRLPTDNELKDVLLKILDHLCHQSVPTNGDTIEPGETYIIIDAIDAITIDQRQAYTQFIEDIIEKKYPHFHILISSTWEDKLMTWFGAIGSWTRIDCDPDSVQDLIHRYTTAGMYDRLIDENLIRDEGLLRWTYEQLVNSQKGQVITTFRWIYWKIQDLKKLDNVTKDMIDAVLRPESRKRKLSEEGEDPAHYNAVSDILNKLLNKRNGQ
ncbi:SIR2-like domain-containing protein [Whalleya microplaca]|nr:SIR2-like domain-containing protein [Whalleya microplaca]